MFSENDEEQRIENAFDVTEQHDQLVRVGEQTTEERLFAHRLVDEKTRVEFERPERRVTQEKGENDAENQFHAARSSFADARSR